MKASEVVAEVLKYEEVEVIFGIPGVHILPVYDALYGRDDLKVVIVKHEQAAAFMADGYARSTGKIGVCLLASGPGVLNAVAAVSEAYMASVPLVILSGGVPLKSKGKGAVHELDQLQVFKSITKWQKIVEASQEISYIIHKACSLASSNRPRPVYVELPMDILKNETEMKIPKLSAKAVTFKEEPVKKAMVMLAAAEKPVILAGGGVITAEATADLTELSSILRIPVVVTYMGRAGISEDSEFFLGLLPDKYSFSIIDQADIILALGCKFSEIMTAGFKSKFSRLIQVDIDPDEIGKNYPVELGVVGDIKIFLRILVEAAKSFKVKYDQRKEWLEAVSRLKYERTLEYEVRASSEEIPIKPQRLMKELSNIVTSETIITCDSGDNTWWTNIFMKPQKPRKLLTPTGNWTMGFALPAALGAKCGNPDAQVLSVCGDGSFMMSCSELATAVEYNLPVIVVVINNGRLGAICNYQKYTYGCRYIASKLKNPSFTEVAEAFGAKGITIKKPEEIKNALRTALNSNLPTVLDIHVDGEEEIPSWFLETFYGKRT